MTVEEELKRIAVATERQAKFYQDITEIVRIFYLVFIVLGIAVIGFLLFAIFADDVYSFFAYDVLGYDRPTIGGGFADVAYIEVNRYEPTLDDQMVELARMAYRVEGSGNYVQEIYKNCVFGLLYQYDPTSNYTHGFDMFIDNYRSNKVCYQSMKDEITDSLKYVIVEQKFLQMDFLRVPPVDFKNQTGLTLLETNDDMFQMFFEECANENGSYFPDPKKCTLENGMVLMYSEWEPNNDWVWEMLRDFK